MATHTEFQVYFEQQGQAREQLMFVEEEHELNGCSIIRENIDVTVLFQSSYEDCRLYIEGLDDCVIQTSSDGEGESYLLPSSQKKLLFSHENFPLIPGDYLVRVYCGRWYYAMLRIQPKQVTESQLQVMKDEVQEFLEGLAYDVVSQGSVYRMVPHEFAHKARVLQYHYKTVLPALVELVSHANYEMATTYESKINYQPIVMDAETFAQRLRYPDRAHEWRVPVRRLNYDIHENRWIKSVVQMMKPSLIEMRNESVVHQSMLKRQLQREGNSQKRSQLQKALGWLENVYKEVSQLIMKLNILQSASWWHEVGIWDGNILPRAAQLNAKYRAFLHIYRDWCGNRSMNLDASYHLRWKRTDKLYETWGFIQFLKLLIEELHFSPQEGWIFSNSHSEQIQIPTLDRNTSITLKRGNLKVLFVYEGEIPSEPAHTSLQVPLYTDSTNNCPDMRMDVFEEDVYMGSLVFDFKYRPLHHIWDATRVRQKTATMKKLTNYAGACRSLFLFGLDYAKYIRPVHEVWAIHPNVHVDYPVSKVLEHHALRIVQLSPKHDMSHIAEDLNKSLTEMIEKRRLFR
ncbi:nuclease domain-containing protein [Ectobacillus antri]|jgi:hypothetical protein|uniref:Nuclease domain-containing protein n=1 Tax=Ectobacillus antri TaxID=2486280 RepID=A0ABT6H9Q9_9BACI|nr:nuclease domain-containing protein [Ectobacillus antri]MDG4658019.1 nuclease domain-containing protein [Ectobacillus antri]MDG5755091.1 nuclease domain-containing protein [Ectobacillus antri]